MDCILFYEHKEVSKKIYKLVVSQKRLPSQNAVTLLSISLIFAFAIHISTINL